MPGGSRIVMDLKRPARIDKAYVLEAENGQPPKLIVELVATDRASFMQSIAVENRKALAAATPDKTAAAVAAAIAGGNGNSSNDTRPVVVIDPGHGGIDEGAQTASGVNEKSIVLEFAKALRARIEKAGKYRVVMTRDDDTFIPLADRVKIARQHKAALFLSVHADSLPGGQGDAQGATIYTLSDTASDEEAAKLAEAENRADAIAGINLTEEPADVADILIDLARRETKTFSNRFARTLVKEMKQVARLHKHPLKSAGFRVLKAPDVPSVLLELGYVSNKDDYQLLVSDSWRSRTVGSVAQAVELFFGKRMLASDPKKEER
jgi:N-acetylmuramoyl-L-alanine amidase